MYYLYQHSQTPQGVRFVCLRDVRLFGCRAGEIPRLLRAQLPPKQSEPFPWHVSVEAVLSAQCQALLIDLKPNYKNPQAALSLFQVRDAWGYSAYGWAPGMLRLRGISVDGRPQISDPKDFVVEFEPHHESIYTFLYLEGTVREGALLGRWTAPRPSSTNSVLLWPEPLSYLVRQIQETNPQTINLNPDMQPAAVLPGLIQEPPPPSA